MSGASYGQSDITKTDESSELFALDPKEAKPAAQPPAAPAPAPEPASAPVTEAAPIVPAPATELPAVIEVPPAAPLPEPTPAPEQTPVAESTPASPLEPTPAPEPTPITESTPTTESQASVEPPAPAVAATVPESAAVTESEPTAAPVTEPQAPAATETPAPQASASAEPQPPAAETPTAEPQPPATPAALATEPQPPAEPSSNAPNIFERQGLGYRIAYPADWVYEAPTQHQIIFSGKQGTPAYYSTVSVQNVKSSRAGGKHDSINSVKESLVNQLTAGSTETKIYDEKPYTYERADKPALQGVEFMAEYINNKEKFKQWIIIVERPSKEVYHIWSYASPSEQYDSFIGVARDMLDSWVIK